MVLRLIEMILPEENTRGIQELLISRSAQLYSLNRNTIILPFIMSNITHKYINLAVY